MVKILYEDKALVVCVKEPGVLSETGGMPELLSQQLGGAFFCIHRLDKAVGGVMVYARDKLTAARLSSAAAARELGKEYLAAVEGRMETKSGELNDLLYHDAKSNKTYVVKRMRRGVREARLSFSVLETQEVTEGELSLLRIELYTGRSHQIRVQLGSRGHPLCGDPRYGSRYRQGDLALWSERLSFIHPVSGQRLRFQLDPPEKWPWLVFDSLF